MGDDIMLNYQTNSFHDIATVRQLLNLRPAPSSNSGWSGTGSWKTAVSPPAPGMPPFSLGNAMQEQEIHDLVASVLDALKSNRHPLRLPLTMEWLPQPRWGMAPRAVRRQRRFQGKPPLTPIGRRRWKTWAAPLSVSLAG